MVANDWFVQNLADLCACPIDRPEVIETTAAGAAMLAMVKLGWFDSLADFAAGWRPNAAFEPSMPENQRAHKQRVWRVLEPFCAPRSLPAFDKFGLSQEGTNR